MSQHWIVTAPAGGTRRAGRHWPQGATIVPATELDEAALALIEADPRMDLVYVGVDLAGEEVSETEVTRGVADLISDLADVIRGLPAEGYTKGGLPDLKALSALTQRQITAVERDAAWGLLQETGFVSPAAG